MEPASEKHWLETIFESPYVWGALTLVAIAFGFSPRESGIGTWLSLAFGLCTAAAAMWFHPFIRTHQKRSFFTSLGTLLTAVLLVPLGVWLTRPKDTEEPRLRIMEFLPSVAMGKPIALRVHYMNDGSKSTRVVCKYTFAWIEELPDPSNLKAYADLENEAWNSLTNKPATGIPGTQAISEKTFVTAPPKIGLEFTEITNIVATPDIVRKLDGNSAIYFAGRATDAEDKELLIYCVRLDKNRNQIVTMCKEHN